MAITENEIRELNNFLVSDSFEIVEFDKLYQTIKVNNNFKIKFIDFEYYNEKRLDEARREKIICVQLKNYEMAARNLFLEMECQNYAVLKTEYKIEKSSFHYEQKYLIYFYLGTAKNDKLVREYLKIETL